MEGELVKGFSHARRGLSALGGIALTLVFAVLLVSLSMVVAEHGRYCQTAKTVNETVAAKSKENLRVVQVSKTLLNITNEGSIQSLILGIYRVNPPDMNPNYLNITPTTIQFFGSTLVPIPETPEEWFVGVVTSYGNVFWESPQQ